VKICQIKKKKKKTGVEYLKSPAIIGTTIRLGQTIESINAVLIELCARKKKNLTQIEILTHRSVQQQNCHARMKHSKKKINN